VDILLLEAPASASSAASTLLEWIARSARGGLWSDDETGHAGDHFRVGGQGLGVQQLGKRAVGDAKPHIHRLELFVDEQPDLTSRFNRGQRREERVDRVGTLRRASRLGRWGPLASSSATSPTASESATCAAKPATATQPAAARAARVPIADAGALLR